MGGIIFLLIANIMPPFKSALLDWIGDRSYRIYLCHIPIMLMTKYILDIALYNTELLNNPGVYITTFLIATAILSDLSYKYIETKFIKHYKNKTNSPSF
jgi:peptidoglycan/LPS O-acetylase OafA/YrhL